MNGSQSYSDTSERGRAIFSEDGRGPNSSRDRFRQDARFARLLSTEILWEAWAGVIAAGLWVLECGLPKNDPRRVERRQRRQARRQVHDCTRCP